jgi:hypothetical protein
MLLRLEIFSQETSNQGVKLFTLATSDYVDILTYNKDKTEIFARDFLQTSETECWIATEIRHLYL